MHDIWIAIAIVLGLFAAQGVLENWLRRRIDRAADQRRAGWVLPAGANPPGALHRPTPVEATTPDAPRAAAVLPQDEPSLAAGPMPDAIYARRRAISSPVHAPSVRSGVRPDATGGQRPATRERRFESTLH